MRNIKTLLKILGGTALTTVAASSIVACGNQKKVQLLDGKYAKLLGWYIDENKSSIQLKLKKDDTTNDKETYLIDIDDSDNKKITEIKFNEKLLKAGTGTDSDKFEALNNESSDFLKELGFTTIDNSNFYSNEDISKINNLSVKIENVEKSKIELNKEKDDFGVSNSICQINIIDNSDKDNEKSIQKYNIKIDENNKLGIPNAVAEIVTKDNLELTKENNFQKDGKVLTNLPWNKSKNKEKNLYNSLVNMIGDEKLVWSTIENGDAIDKYPNDDTTDVFLRIMFKELKVVSFQVDKMPN